MVSSTLQWFAVLSALLPLALADDKATECCAALAEALPQALAVPVDSIYQETNNRYYIETQAELEPTCRVMPSTAEEVATIVSIAAEKSCPFAVASGKHFAITGGSNIGPEGFTIDLMNLRATTLSEDKTVASIGPGLRAGEVYDYFNQFGVYCSVGRDSDVGVGGFLVGGGISFPSFEHGLGSNTAVNFEIVTAAGEVVNANATSNPELYWGIKMGSSNLGIVTRFDLEAYPSPNMWAGFQSFSMDDADAIIGQGFPDAVSYLSEHNNEAGVLLFTFNETTPDSFFVTEGYYRDGEAFPPLWQALVGDGFNATFDTMATKSFPEFLEEIKLPSSAQQTIWKTLDVLPDGDFVIQAWKKGQELHEALSAEGLDIPGLTYDMTFQPMLKTMRCATNAGPACGGADEDLMSILFRQFWDVPGSTETNDRVAALHAEWEQWLIDEAKARGIYNDFTYLNYIGSVDNSPYVNMPEDTLARLLEVQATYDPESVFATLWKGGFKLPSTV